MKKSEIDALITQRINLFHDALVERGQIKPMPVTQMVDEESVSRYKGDQGQQSDHSPLAFEQPESKSC